MNQLKNIKLDTTINHEANIEQILIQNGFLNGYIYANTDLFYFHQPNGSQKPPDFRVHDNDEYIDIECKSSKSSYKPMWNCSIPNRLTYYLFTNTKENNTVIVKGDQIATIQLIKLLNDYKAETKMLENKYNELLISLSEEENPYKMSVYARNMFVQKRNFPK
jgi:hypothetical protein